jgi:hypothetical protein
MTAREIRLPEPPRRVVAGEGGALVFEFESAVAQLRFDSTAFELRAVPEQPGELLVAPRGREQCVMLGPAGTLKIYAGKELLHKRPSALRENDEFIDARVRRDGGLVMLVGARVGDELLLPVPEFRFVSFDRELERIGGPDSPPMSSRPMSWDLDERNGTAIVLQSAEAGAQLCVTRLSEGTVESVALPPDIAEGRLTGIAVDPPSGSIVLARLADAVSELRGWSPRVGRHVRLATVVAPEELSDPQWSPDARKVMFKRISGGGTELLSIHLASLAVQVVCPLSAGAQTIWVDADTVAVIDWDELDWYRI